MARHSNRTTQILPEKDEYLRVVAITPSHPNMQNHLASSPTKVPDEIVLSLQPIRDKRQPSLNVNII